MACVLCVSYYMYITKQRSCEFPLCEHTNNYTHSVLSTLSPSIQFLLALSLSLPSCPSSSLPPLPLPGPCRSGQHSGCSPSFLLLLLRDQLHSVGEPVQQPGLPQHSPLICGFGKLISSLLHDQRTGRREKGGGGGGGGGG